MPRLKTLDTRLKSLEPKHQPKKNWGKGRGGRQWRRKRERVLKRDQYTCQACGRVTTELECDHVVNTARGGTDDECNLQSLCKDCHADKTAKESRGY